jgi:predicted  nucleic acid-binding Zn-ribbon protein
MANTEEDIQYLIQIVKKDLEIQEKRKFLAEAPVRIAEIEKEIKIMERDLEETRNEFEILEKERRHLEREIKAQNQKIDQKKLEQHDADSNKVYRALGHEIEYLSKLVYKEEERVLVILEKTEGKKKQIDKFTVDVDERKKKLLGEKDALENDIKAADDNLKVLEDEKVRVLPHLSPRVRRLYDRILNVKGDSGVANLIGDICQGCYSRVPPQKAHEIRKNDQILTCEACGRILVHYGSD